MPQTMLGLLALVLASLIGFNQQQVTQRVYNGMVRDELEIAASGTAMHVLEMAAARSFDERTTPDVIRNQGVPGAVSLFTLPSAFGAADRGTGGCDLMEPVLTGQCDDIDDLDGLRWIPVSAELAGDRELLFEVSVDVDYVASPSSTVPSLVPTAHKRVVLTLRSPHLQNLEGGFVEIARVISYDRAKAVEDHERIYGPLGT